MTTQTAVSLKLSAAKLELKAALSSLERVSSHDYSPHQAALIRGAQFQIERALRITGQIYLRPPTPSTPQQGLEAFDVITPPLLKSPVTQQQSEIAPRATALPTEDVIHEDIKQS